MKNKEKYCVANSDGELIGHDLSYTRACLLCEQMVDREPENEWEVLKQ